LGGTPAKASARKARRSATKPKAASAAQEEPISPVRRSMRLSSARSPSPLLQPEVEQAEQAAAAPPGSPLSS
ncbi:unnamed protein product, partial [Chrysoparadoxa australica]